MEGFKRKHIDPIWSHVQTYDIADDYITVLRGDKRLGKLFAIEKEEIESLDAPFAYAHVYEAQRVSNLQEFYNLIKEIAPDNQKCIIRGRSVYGAGHDVRRCLEQFRDVGTQWVVLDYDGIDLGFDGEAVCVEHVEHMIKTELPKCFWNASYFIQWSSSAGIKHKGKYRKNGLNAHVHFWLDKALTKEQLNVLFDGTQTDMALFRPVQACYTSDPMYVAGIECEIEERLVMVDKGEDVVMTPSISTFERKERKTTEKRKKVNVHYNKDECDAVLKRLYDIGCISSENSDTVNMWHQEETSQGGFWMFKSDTTKVLHHNPEKNGLELNQWLQKYWDIKPTQDSRELNDVSGGDIDVVRRLVKGSYGEFFGSATKHLTVRTAPGVGKTFSIPEVWDGKIIFSRGSNQGVRELARGLLDAYPNRKIRCLVAFGETFKDEFPDAELVKRATKDVFKPDTVDWTETFAKLPELDRARAEKLHKLHNSLGERLLQEWDIIVMTTTMLRSKLSTNLIVPTKKGVTKIIDPVVEYDRLVNSIKHKRRFKNMKVNHGKCPTVTRNVGESDYAYQKRRQIAHRPYFQALRLRLYERYVTNEILWEHQKVPLVPLNTLIVVDDITKQDTGLHQNMMSGDEDLIEEHEASIKKKNSKLKRSIVETRFNRFESKVIKDLRIARLESKINRFEYEVDVFENNLYVRKPAYASIVYPHYKTIWTCAEVNQVEDIQFLLDKKGIEYTEIDFTEVQQVNNVLVIPTDLCKAHNHGLIPVIKNFLDRTTKSETVLIANGAGTKWNHSNISGVNALQKSNLIIKISRLHPDALEAIQADVVDDLENDSSGVREWNALAGMFDQAVGRASGWRDKGKVVVVLVDPTVWMFIEKKVLYQCATKPWETIGETLKSIADDTNGWFLNRDYDQKALKRDAMVKVNQLNKNDLKRMLQLYTALNNLKPSVKRDNLKQVVVNTLIDFYYMIGKVVKLVRDDDTGNQKFLLKDLDVKNAKTMLRVLNIKTTRNNGEGIFFMSRKEASDLLVLRHSWGDLDIL